jgi:hypothetical protein
MWIREQLAELGNKRLYILSGHNRMMVELPSNSEVYQDEFLSFFLSFFLFWVEVGFVLRGSCLLGKTSTT